MSSPYEPYRGDATLSPGSRIAAILAHLSAPIAALLSAGSLSLLGPLLVWLAKKHDPYVRRAAAAMLSGIQVGNLFEDQKVFEVVVWGAPAVRNSLSSIQDLKINTPSGQQIRLGDVADVTIAPSPTVIERDSV